MPSAGPGKSPGRCAAQEFPQVNSELPPMGKSAPGPMGVALVVWYYFPMNLKYSPQFTASRTLMMSLLLGVAATGAALAANPTSSTNANPAGSDSSYSASVTVPAASTTTSRSARHFLKKAHELGQKEIALSELAQTRASNLAVKSFAQLIVTEHGRMTTDLAVLGDIDVQGVALRSSARSTDSAAAWNDPATGPVTSTTTTQTVDSQRATTGAGSANGSVADNRTTDSYGNRVTYNSPMGNSPGTERTTVNSASSSTTVSATAHGEGAYSGNPDEADSKRGWTYKHLAGKSGADFDKAYLKAMVDEHEDAIKQFEKAAKDKDDPAIQNFAAKYLPTLREHLAQAQALQKTIG
jgi:predicted outer membrane protein